jgi:amidohydrolase
MNAPDSLALPDQVIDAHAGRIEAQVIAWRRQIHANPELGNREFETAKLVART